MAYFSKIKKALKKGKKTLRPRKKASKKVFRKAVKRVLDSTAEKKIVRYNYSLTSVAGIGYYNSVSWGLDNGLFVISPLNNRLDITSGTGQSNRIGNRIRTYSAMLNCVLLTQPHETNYNPIPKPMDVLVYIYKVKGGGNTVQNTLSGFYQNNNSSIAPTSSQLDTLLPVNLDTYTVLYKRMFKLGFATNTGTGSQNVYQNYTSNDYKRTCRFRVNLTKLLDKVYRFDDTTDTPTNSLLYMAVMPVASDNVIPAAGNGLRPVGLMMDQYMRFTDY